MDIVKKGRINIFGIIGDEDGDNVAVRISGKTCDIRTASPAFLDQTLLLKDR